MKYCVTNWWILSLYLKEEVEKEIGSYKSVSLTSRVYQALQQILKERTIKDMEVNLKMK